MRPPENIHILVRIRVRCRVPEPVKVLGFFQYGDIGFSLGDETANIDCWKDRTKGFIISAFPKQNSQVFLLLCDKENKSENEDGNTKHTQLDRVTYKRKESHKTNQKMRTGILNTHNWIESLMDAKNPIPSHLARVRQKSRIHSSCSSIPRSEKAFSAPYNLIRDFSSVSHGIRSVT
jgi:hypothetical protein